MALISCAVTAQLICAFVLAYADCWFSDAAAHLTISDTAEFSNFTKMASFTMLHTEELYFKRIANVAESQS